MEKIKGFYHRMVNYVLTGEGQGLVEYALILVLIALVVIVVLRGVGTSTNNVYSAINSALKTP